MLPFFTVLFSDPSPCCFTLSRLPFVFVLYPSGSGFPVGFPRRAFWYVLIITPCFGFVVTFL